METTNASKPFTPSDIFSPQGETAYQYLHLRYRLVGRGITGEFTELVVNGAKVIEKHNGDGCAQWGQNEHELLTALGEAGWQLISYRPTVVSEGGMNAGHYAVFCRSLARHS